MRAVILLIFILVMSPGVYADFDWNECIDTMIRMIHIDTELTVENNDPDCAKFVAIRPYNGRKWEITMSDVNANPNTGLRIVDNNDEKIFQCKGKGASAAPGVIVSETETNGPSVQCSFNASVADGKRSFIEVFPKIDEFRYTSDQTNGILLELEYKKITKKINCTSTISYDASSCKEAGESCEQPLYTDQYACSDPQFKLQYQYGKTPWTLTKNIKCKVGEYVAYDGKDHRIEDDNIRMKCARKKCRQCTDPNVAAKFVETNQYDECFHLQCNTSQMLINGNITYPKSNLTCADAKWKVENTEIGIKRIECIEESKCPSTISYDNSSCEAAGESCEEPIYTYNYKCANKRSKLLYKYGDTPWTWAYNILCKVGEYVAYNGTDHSLKYANIRMKCAQKKCRQCTDPNASARFVEPSEYNECVNLQCNTSRMIINGNIAHAHSNLTCSDAKWKVNNAEIDVKSIECVEKYDCRKILPLADKPKPAQYKQPSLSADLVLSCDPKYQMAIVDQSTNKDMFVYQIACDSGTGVWLINDMGNRDIAPPTTIMNVKCLPPKVEVVHKLVHATDDTGYIVAVAVMAIIVLIALWFTVSEILEFIKEIRNDRQEEARVNAEQNPVVPSPGGLLTLEEVFGKYKYERFLKSVEKKLQ